MERRRRPRLRAALRALADRVSSDELLAAFEEARPTKAPAS